jgi:hypothetical protein
VPSLIAQPASHGDVSSAASAILTRDQVLGCGLKPASTFQGKAAIFRKSFDVALPRRFAAVKATAGLNGVGALARGFEIAHVTAP